MEDLLTEEESQHQADDGDLLWRDGRQNLLVLEPVGVEEQVVAVGAGEPHDKPGEGSDHGHVAQDREARRVSLAPVETCVDAFDQTHGDQPMTEEVGKDVHLAQEYAAGANRTPQDDRVEGNDQDVEQLRNRAVPLPQLPSDDCHRNDQ